MDNSYKARGTTRRRMKDSRILLIEDDKDQIRLIQTVIKAAIPEIDLMVASTHDEVLRLLAGNQQAGQPFPRLILLDLYLPERENGWQILRSLKAATSPYRLIPVTLLSHSAQPDDIQTAYDLGTNSYITKPADYEQWVNYFQTLRQYWWQTVTLPQ